MASLAGVLLLAAGGCVTPAEHHASVARGRSLEHEMSRLDEEMTSLRRRYLALHQVGSRLKLERESLDAERVELLGEIEEARQEYEALQTALLQEQRAREAREQEIQQLSGTYKSLVDTLEREVEEGKLEIHRLKGRLQVRALDRILFDSGSAAIKPEGAEVLRKIAGELARIANHRIRVEGHTDDVPIRTERFPSNWELSVARAAGVVRFLIESGLEAERLSAEGFGPYQPIAANDSVKNRARNRRIEIVLVPDSES